MMLKRTPPPPEVVVMDNRDYFFTESTFPPKADPREIWELFKDSKTTGQLLVDFSQGAVNNVRLKEQTKLDDAQANEVRRVCGFDYEVEVTEEVSE